MSDGNVCSDDSMYGGFGAMMANWLHCEEREHAPRQEEGRAAHPQCAVAAASTAPSCANESVAAVRASGTKKSPPSLSPITPTSPKAPTSARRRLAAAPAPIPLIAVDRAVVRAPVEKKSQPSFLLHPLWRPHPFSFNEPILPSGILVEIVGTEMSCQGHLCKEHDICGKVLKEDVVVRLRKMQLMVEGKEEMAITAIWVMDGVDRCRVGFVPCHMVRHVARFNGALV